MPKKIKMPKGESILAAWAEPARGPGWSNQPLWYVTNRGGDLNLHAIQPEGQTPEMVTLYNISAAVHAALTKAIEAIVEKDNA